MSKTDETKFFSPPDGVRVASDFDVNLDMVMVFSESAFALAINNLFKEQMPEKIIETGTYFGTGTTVVIASALKELGLEGSFFCSIEVNPEHCKKAVHNLRESGLIKYVHLLNGLTLPRTMLPTYEEIEEQFVNNIEFDNIFIDFYEDVRAKSYFNETNFTNVPEDLLGKCLRKFNNRPDFVLLDSAGHLGHYEFTYLINRVEARCYIALDDIYHIKHYKNYIQINSDSRFKIITESREKFGYCMAEFTP